VVREFEAAAIRPPVVHAANSAAAIAHPASRYDLVRCGIAIYGLDPSPALDGLADLRPAMTLRSTVSFVKEVAAGERISYGLRHTFAETTVVATIPIGYADGVRRRLSAVGADVLIGGRRCPIVGTITMDQLMVDCGPGAAVRPGDDVVLLGEQGGECITAREWADRLDTIEYEVVCDVGPRVQRCYR
jgi:alanine racemase